MSALDEFIEALEDYSKEGRRVSLSIEINPETAGDLAIRLKACAGVDTERLEHFRLAASLAYIKELEQQRDELLAAAVAYLGSQGKAGEFDALERLENAIAKAGGE